MNFDVVKNADWIVEAVVDRIDIKHQIYDKIFESRKDCLLYTSPSPRDKSSSRMPSSA